MEPLNIHAPGPFTVVMMRLLLILLVVIVPLAGEDPPLHLFAALADELAVADREHTCEDLDDASVAGWKERIAACAGLGRGATATLEGLFEQARGPVPWPSGRRDPLTMLGRGVQAPLPHAQGATWSIARVADAEPLAGLWERIFEAPYHPALAGDERICATERISLFEPGLYLLTCRAEGRRAARWLTRDDLRGRALDDGHRLVLAFAGPDESPQLGVEVLAVAELPGQAQVARVLSGTSGADGCVEFSVEPPGALAVTVRWVARRGQAVCAGVTQLQRPGLARSSHYGRPDPAAGAARALQVHCASECPVYRPGDVARLAFTVRRWRAGRLEAHAGALIGFKAQIGGEALVTDTTVTLDAFGRAGFDFPIPPTAALGEVQAWCSWDGLSQQVQGLFRIEEYRLPEAELLLELARDRLHSSENAEATVTARSLSGETLEGLSGWLEVREHLRLPFTTGAGGIARLSVAAALLQVGDTSLRAVVADPGGRTLSASRTVSVGGGYHLDRLTLALADPWTTPDEGIALVVRSADSDGRARPARVRLSIGHVEKLPPVDLEIPDSGSVALRLRVPRSGSWYIRASGIPEERNLREANTTALVVDSGSSGLWVRADRPEYRIGDEAVVRVAGSAPWALAIVDAGGFGERHLLDLRRGHAELRLPVRSSFAEGVRVLVSAHRPALEPYNSGALQAGLRLAITPPESPLTVTVTAPPHAAPGEAIRIQVQASAAGVVALGVVDEALYRIAEDRAPRLDTFFMPVPRAAQIRAEQPVHPVWDDESVLDWFQAGAEGTRHLRGRTAFGIASGAGGKFCSRAGGSRRSSVQAQQDSLRTDLRASAFWSAAIPTDDQGHAEVSLRLPENLGSWRVTARLATRDRRAGEARVVFVAAKPVMVRLVAPRVLRPGETTSLQALVTNTQSTAIQTQVAWDLDGFTLTELTPGIVDLAPGETRTLVQPVTVSAGTSATAAVRVGQDQVIADGVRVVIPIEAAGFPRTWVAGGLLSPRASSVRLPACGEGAVLRLHLARDPAAVVAEAAAFLRGFPYGCAEQTLSRALPAAAIAPLLSPAQRADPVFADLPEILVESLARLARSQRHGTWGWWPGAEPEAWITAWGWTCLRALEHTGATLPGPLIEQRAALARRLAEAISDPDLCRSLLRQDDGDLAFADRLAEARLRHEATLGRGFNAHAALLLASALAGHGVTAADFSGLVAGVDRLAAVERALLALSLQRAGDPAAARMVWARACAGGGPDSGLDPALEAAWWTCAAEALEPGSARAGESLQRLLGLRRGGTWGTTWATGAALLAIGDHLRNGPFAISTAALGVSVDGIAVDLSTARVRGDGLRLELPLPTTGALLEVSGTGCWNAVVAWRTGDPAPACAEGLGVRRTVWKLERGDLGQEVRMPVVDGTSVPVGSLLLVELTLSTAHPVEHVLLEDPKASGIEPLLGDSGVRHGLSDNRELRRDRTAFFFSRLPVGDTTIAYRARVELSGAPCWPPASAEAMYAPRLRGTTAALHLSVGAAVPAVPNPVIVADHQWLRTRIAAVTDRLSQAGDHQDAALARLLLVLQGAWPWISAGMPGWDGLAEVELIDDLCAVAWGWIEPYTNPWSESEFVQATVRTLALPLPRAALVKSWRLHSVGQWLTIRHLITPEEAMALLRTLGIRSEMLAEELSALTVPQRCALLGGGPDRIGFPGKWWRDERYNEKNPPTEADLKPTVVSILALLDHAADDSVARRLLPRLHEVDWFARTATSLGLTAARQIAERAAAGWTAARAPAARAAWAKLLDGMQAGRQLLPDWLELRDPALRRLLVGQFWTVFPPQRYGVPEVAPDLVEQAQQKLRALIDSEPDGAVRAGLIRRLNGQHADPIWLAQLLATEPEAAGRVSLVGIAAARSDLQGAVLARCTDHDVSVRDAAVAFRSYGPACPELITTLPHISSAGAIIGVLTHAQRHGFTLAPGAALAAARRLAALGTTYPEQAYPLLVLDTDRDPGAVLELAIDSGDHRLRAVLVPALIAHRLTLLPRLRELAVDAAADRVRLALLVAAQELEVPAALLADHLAATSAAPLFTLLAQALAERCGALEAEQAFDRSWPNDRRDLVQQQVARRLLPSAAAERLGVADELMSAGTLTALAQTAGQAAGPALARLWSRADTARRLELLPLAAIAKWSPPIDSDPWLEAARSGRHWLAIPGMAATPDPALALDAAAAGQRLAAARACWKHDRRRVPWRTATGAVALYAPWADWAGW